jgi:hypothetical protein
MPVFHSTISRIISKKINKEIMFLYLFATGEICSASIVVENVENEPNNT